MLSPRQISCLVLIGLDFGLAEEDDSVMLYSILFNMKANGTKASLDTNETNHDRVIGSGYQFLR